MIFSFVQKLTKFSDFYLMTLFLLGLLAFDLLSYISLTKPLLGGVLTIILVVLWLFTATKNLALGVIFLLLELVIGSFGRLVSLNIDSLEINLRLALYLAAFGLMVYHIASNRKHIIFSHPWRWWFVAAIFSLIWAAGRGYYFWNSTADIVLDANGYLYILLLPLFLEAYFEFGQEKILYYTKLFLWPGIIWLTIRTLFLLYIFTHFEIDYISFLYHWYRDLGLGEITAAGGGFFRIFSQSHVYSSLAAVFGFVWLRHKLNSNLPLTSFSVVQSIFYVFIPLIALVVSLSRSLWLGTLVAWFLSIFIQGTSKKIITTSKYLLLSFILVTGAIGLVMITSKINWPFTALGSGSIQAFSDRFYSEPAGQARMNLLPHLLDAIKRQLVWGGGFGAQILYFSTDPRAVQSTAGSSGLISTYALEWGWLDFMYKFGLIGFILLTVWLIIPFWSALKFRKKLLINTPAVAAVLGLVALYITHITTPYLNHPLGLGAVLALGTIIFSSDQKS